MTRPANFGRRWDESADAELRERLVRLESLATIAIAMGRSNHAIRGRAGELHLTITQSARPWRHGVKR